MENLNKTTAALAAVILLFTIAFSGCYYDNEERLFPELPGTCDTTQVSYSGDVVTILSASCLSCHSNQAGASLGGNVFMEDYADVATNSDAILGAISHAAGYSPMPKGGGKLSDCKILTFEAWINQGKQEN